MEPGTYKFSYTSPGGEKTKVQYVCAHDVEIEELADMCMGFVRALGYTNESIMEHFNNY